MDIRDLRSRIDSIKEKTSGLDRKQESKTHPQADTGAVLTDNGWTKLADMVFEKVTVRKNILPEVISEVLLTDLSSEGASGDDIGIATGVPASRLIFYDTETTGLSAGAGNIVFLAGFGECIPETADFKITQVFLSDFPGEPAFLQRVAEFILPGRVYVSYNGKSFDANILNSRFLMNGMRGDFGFQMDLLYSSRRLWKNVIGSCSLGDIERQVLDKRRSLDVPGFMVPDLYFDFIRSARWDALKGVLAHHLEDIYSLSELLNIHEQLFTEAGTGPAKKVVGQTDFFDPLGLSSLLIGSRPEAAAEVLRSAFEAGNSRAGIELSLLHKRAGNWISAVEIWNRLWQDGRSIFAGIELAKYYEHRAGDANAALDLTCSLLKLERFRIGSYVAELQKRKNRLESRINK